MIPNASAVLTARSCCCCCAGEYELCSVAEPHPTMTRKNVPTNSASTARQKVSDSRRRAVPGRQPPYASVSRRPMSCRQPLSAGRTTSTRRPTAAGQRPSFWSSPLPSETRSTASRSRAVHDDSHLTQRCLAAVMRRPTDCNPPQHTTSDVTS